MRQLPRFSPLSVVAFAMCFTGCDYFTNVVVPATDTVAPASVSGVYDVQQGKYVELSVTSFDFQVTDPTLTYLAVGATYDSGGAKSVQITGGVTLYCNNGHGIGEAQFQDWGPQSASQSGGVGSTVSNGVWTYYAVRFDSLASCAEGFFLEELDFGWETVSVDFHGNTSYSSGTMTYVP